MISRLETNIYKKIAVRSIFKSIEQAQKPAPGSDGAHSECIAIRRVYHRYELFVIGYVVHHNIIGN